MKHLAERHIEHELKVWGIKLSKLRSKLSHLKLDDEEVTTSSTP
jgi:hypothetical protein